MKVRVAFEYDLPPGDRGTVLQREERRWMTALPELGSATIEVELVETGVELAETVGPKPRYTREQFNKVRAMLDHQSVGITQIVQETGLTRQTVYRIKDDPAGAEAALAVWGL